MIRGKTAELFAAACEVGPVLAERPKAEQAACRSFGMNLGIAFQLVDDALDYGGVRAKLGKNVGDDFREGKITLPVVLAFRRGDEAEREFWRRTLERGEIDDGDLETRHRPDAPSPRARGHDRARPPLWRDGQGCAGPVRRQPDEVGAGRCGGFLHRPRALRWAALRAWRRVGAEARIQQGKSFETTRLTARNMAIGNRYSGFGVLPSAKSELIV